VGVRVRSLLAMLGLFIKRLYMYMSPIPTLLTSPATNAREVVKPQVYRASFNIHKSVDDSVHLYSNWLPTYRISTVYWICKLHLLIYI
jgi:hypothetical protein